MRCHGTNSPEPRRCAVPRSDTSALRIADTSALHAEDQQLYNRTSLTSRAHRWSLCKRREPVLSSLPTHPLFSPTLGPRSLKLRVSFLVFALHVYVSYVQAHPFHWLQPHALQSIRFLDSLLSKHIIRYHMCPWGGSFPVATHDFSSRGVAAVRARRLFPSTIQGKGLSSPSYLWFEN